MTTAARPSEAARNQVARRANGQQDDPVARLGGLVERMKPEMARALPKHLDADRMTRLVLTTIRKTPQLADCTPESFLGSVMTCSQLGLEPGTDEAYLIPRRNKGVWEATCVIGYQGYAKLFWQSPQAKHIAAEAVYEADDFDYELGMEPRLYHKPAMDERGKVIAYYAVATLTSGGSAFVVLSPEDVVKLRGPQRPSQIADPMHWLEKKTALRQLVKLLPRSSSLNAALANDGAVRTDPAPAALDQAVPVYIDAEPVDDPLPAEEPDIDPLTGETLPPGVGGGQ